MRSFFENKTWVLLVSILALGALTVLSVSLKNVSFNDAQPIGREEAEPFAGPPEVVREPFGEVSLRTQIILWVVLVILLGLIALLLSPEGRKKMLRILIRVVATYWALYFLLSRYPEILLAFNFNLNGAGPNEAENVFDVPPQVFTPPRETPFISYAVSVIFVLVVVYLGWRLYRSWRELNPSGRTSLSAIARIARSSLRDLSSGRDSTDVILNCYFRMGDVVADKKNMQRDLSMTPAEFASRLEQSGLPGDAVQRLTRLFEGVRYGGQRPGPKEINEAVACLTTILHYCGEAV
jgi:hypothetical protein